MYIKLEKGIGKFHFGRKIRKKIFRNTPMNFNFLTEHIYSRVTTHQKFLYEIRKHLQKNEG